MNTYQQSLLVSPPVSVGSGRSVGQFALLTGRPVSSFALCRQRSTEPLLTARRVPCSRRSNGLVNYLMFHVLSHVMVGRVRAVQFVSGPPSAPAVSAGQRQAVVLDHRQAGSAAPRCSSQRSSSGLRRPLRRRRSSRFHFSAFSIPAGPLWQVPAVPHLVMRCGTAGFSAGAGEALGVCVGAGFNSRKADRGQRHLGSARLGFQKDGLGTRSVPLQLQTFKAIISRINFGPRVASGVTRRFSLPDWRPGIALGRPFGDQTCSSSRASHW